MRHVGENIKRIRKEKKMTISDLAGEQISRGMISLIENGKTQPSIERLQYLAEKLNVNVSDFLTFFTKSELQSIIYQAQVFKDEGNLEEIHSLLSPLLEQLDDSVESAKLFELYAEANRETGEWAYLKAIKNYEKNGRYNDAVSARLLLARNQLMTGDVQTALELLAEMNPTKNASNTIELCLLKAICYESLGEMVKALDLLEEAIQLAQSSLELGKYYDLLKMKSLLHYEVGDHESARSIVNSANMFVQTVQNENLLAEHGIFFIHLEEFYEGNEEIALELADEYVKYMLLESPLGPDIKKEYIEKAYDQKARALVKMEEYSEAMEIFKQTNIEMNEKRTEFPLENAMNIVSNSYLALCLAKLGKQEKARDLAQRTSNKLNSRPHSAYYGHAKEIAEKLHVLVR